MSPAQRLPVALTPPLRIAPRRLLHSLWWGQQSRWRGWIVQPQHLPAFIVGARLVGDRPGVGMPVVGKRPDQMERIAADHQQIEVADVALPLGPSVREHLIAITEELSTLTPSSSPSFRSRYLPFRNS